MPDKESWSLCTPACKIGSCKANLIPSVHLDNIMNSYVSDGVQRVAKRNQQAKEAFTWTVNGWGEKAQLNLERARGLAVPRNTEAAASGRSKEALVLLQPTVSNSKGVLTKQ